MANNYFQFKQFRIIQEKSAMKVGTDGVLLGAWTNVGHTTSVLDVGTGTGLIALMLAQRCNAQITAIEIEKNAAAEATENVRNSPWENRVVVENSSFQDFATATKQKFDLIVSNPPFFSNSLINESKSKTLARHNNALPFTDLLSGVAKLLTANGRFSVILPVISAEEFTELAKNDGLNLARLTKVKPNASKKPNRVLMEFVQGNPVLKSTSISIYDEKSSGYSKGFKELTRSFYMDF